MRKSIRPDPQYANQAAYYEDAYTAAEDLCWAPSPAFQWMDFYMLREFLSRHGEELAGKSLLLGCAGRAFEVPQLMATGLNVTLSDYSQEACSYLNKKYPDLTVKQLDFQYTGLPENSYDVVMVCKGLHHLQRPIQGFYEMMRVARETAVFVEAQDSLPMRSIARYVIGEYEQGPGNYNYRFTRRELEKSLRSLGGCYTLEIHTAWFHPVMFFRTHLFPWLDRHPWAFRLFKAFHHLINFFLGWCGNNMLCIVHKEESVSL